MKRKEQPSPNEERYRSIIEDQPDVIRRFLPDGTITFVNDAYCNFFMRQKEHVVGANLFHMVRKEVEDLVRQSLVSLTPEHPVRSSERLVQLWTGERRWVQWIDRAIFDENGDILEYQSTGRDITNLKSTQQELSRRNDELAALKIFVTELMESRDFNQMLDVALADSQDTPEALSAGVGGDVSASASTDELMTGVRAVVRRWMHTPLSPSQSAIHVGDLAIYLSARRVTMNGNEIELTATEYRLLSELASAAGQVMTTDAILEKVWGNGYKGEGHLVWKIIHRLRLKIEADPKYPRYIHTKPGIGYLLEAR